MSTAAARLPSGRGGGVGEMELRNMSKLIQSLPQYRWAVWGWRIAGVVGFGGCG